MVDPGCGDDPSRAGRWGTPHPGRQQCVWLSVRMHLPAGMAIVGRDREQAELATALTSTRAVLALS